MAQEKNNWIEIETLYILPKLQNQKLGTILIENVVNFTNHLLWLSVWEESYRAIQFYKKMGFKEQGETLFDLYGKKIRNLVFVKE